MSRLRYWIDAPRGPAGAHRDDRHHYASAWSAKNALTRRPAAQRRGATVRVLDLDECAELDADPHALYEQAERRMLFWTEEEARLRGALRGADPTALVETHAGRVAAVVDAAREWRRQHERRHERGVVQTVLEERLYEAIVALDGAKP